MRRTAPMASTIASAVRNTLAPMGARGAIKASAPKAKAISVVIGMPPAARTGARHIKCPIKGGRHDHAADRACDWKRGLFRPRQVAGNQFAFDFEAHQQKEHSHQSVVDPLV